MSFEEYRDSIIEKFIEDMKLCDTLPDGGLSEEQRQEIKERFEEHRECYEKKDSFDEEDMELITSTIYGNNQSAAIECNNCSEVIIDDEVLNQI